MVPDAITNWTMDRVLHMCEAMGSNVAPLALISSYASGFTSPKTAWLVFAVVNSHAQILLQFEICLRPVTLTNTCICKDERKTYTAYARSSMAPMARKFIAT